MEQNGTASLNPTINYNEKLDRIEVVTEKCDVVKEIKVVDSPLIVLSRGHGDTERFIGFCVPEARALCQQFNLTTDGDVEIRHVAEALGKKFKQPEHHLGGVALRGIVFPMIQRHDFQKVKIPTA